MPDDTLAAERDAWKRECLAHRRRELQALLLAALESPLSDPAVSDDVAPIRPASHRNSKMEIQ